MVSGSLFPWIKNYYFFLFSDIHNEITARTQAEEVATELREIARHTPDLIWSVDRQWRLLTANPPFFQAIESKTGSRLAPGAQTLDIQVLTESQQQQWAAWVAKGFSGQTQRVTTELALSAEQEIFELQIYPIPNALGEVRAVGFTARPVTEMVQSKQRIEAQNKALLRIAYLQSHQLRAPVASLLGLVDLLGHENMDAEKDHLLDLVRQAAEQIDARIHEIVMASDALTPSQDAPIGSH